MKNLQIIIMAGMISMAMACNKDNSDPVPATTGISDRTTAQTNTAIAQTTNNRGPVAPNDPSVTYTLQSAPSSPNSLIQWNNGFVTLGNIVFNGNLVIGNAMKNQNYAATVNKQLNLFTKVTLGTINVAGGVFYDPAFELSVSPINNLDIPDNKLVLLSGNSTVNRNTTILFVVNVPMVITAKGINPLNMPVTQKNYTCSLSLQLDGLTNGITAQMLSNAVSEDNIIIISNSSNANLYQLMWNNLQSSLVANFNAVPQSNGVVLPAY